MMNLNQDDYESCKKKKLPFAPWYFMIYIFKKIENLDMENLSSRKRKLLRFTYRQNLTHKKNMTLYGNRPYRVIFFFFFVKFVVTCNKCLYSKKIKVFFPVGPVWHLQFQGKFNKHCIYTFKLFTLSHHIPVNVSIFAGAAFKMNRNNTFEMFSYQYVQYVFLIA